MTRWIVMDCEDCGGTGEVGDEIYQGEFQPPERERCTSCDGSGRWKEEADAALNDAYAEGRKDEREAMQAGRVVERTPGDRFENAIREFGVVSACEWFGHAPDSEFTKESIHILAERAKATGEPR